MAEQFRAGAGVVKKSADIVGQARGDLTTEVKKLQGQMDAVRAHWEGQGARSFHSVSEAWRIQTQDIVDALENFEANLTGAQRQYDADDSNVASNLSKYSSMLGKS
ncbi:WXG100 family type VII secretion target [Phycicoccus sp. BSK3Z-2]|uniref:ESAT-6-like protein n=1 Tax=Phycicoccus avicenniae TaxID=2828860 RepID=A0A941I058_9MICO|nr:WXG100 family type VII secretion target [Phycicoccus avicenniae]MBR7742834.1 WXG100 family type VII secretion target [Phycicoccus avicenniae]